MSIDETEQPEVERKHPADVFAPVAEETRIEILQTFADEQRRVAKELDGEISAQNLIPTFTFSELRDRVGIEDSGRFNYHLDKLLGEYITKYDDDVYAPTWAGVEIVGAVLAGGYGEHEIEQTTIDRSCPSCGAKLVATYEDGFLLVKCTDSDDPVLMAGVPAGVFEGRPMEAAVDVAINQTRRMQEAVTEGYCPLCYGNVDLSLAPATAENIITDADYQYRGICDRCGNTFIGGLATVLLRHPAVVSFYHDHDYDPQQAYTDSFDPIGQGDEITTVLNDEPLAVTVTFVLDDEKLTVTVDKNGEVAEIERANT
jgi:hypothetical protein